MGLDLRVTQVDGYLRIGDTITHGDSRAQWRVVAQSPKSWAWDLEAQMQRADEP